MPNLQNYLRMFADLKVYGGRKPHKPCLLLAVIDLVESGAITDGLVQLNPALRETFSECFAIVAKPDDKDRPETPFSFGHFTSDEEMERAADLVVGALESLAGVSAA